VLTGMVDAFQAERLTIYRNAPTGPFSLVSSQQAYTIGNTGSPNWSTDRPLWIAAMGWYDNSLSTPIEIPIRPYTEDEWSRVRTKPTQSSIPLGYWYDYDYPLGVVYLYPIPTLARQIYIYKPVPLDSNISIDTTFTMPPGYREFIKYQLAIRLAPAYGR